MVEQTTTQQHETYERIHASREFIELRRRYTRFAFPMTIAFMVRCGASTADSRRR